MSDVDYKEFRLIVELDGRAGHEGVGRFRDMDRDNRHALVDATTLRFGHYDLASRPCAVAFQVYCALAVRGYSRCSSAAETASLFQAMTCSSRDYRGHQVTGADCAGYSRHNPPRCRKQTAQADVR